jgi:DNA-binding TFAR19-related protein (PDSD5 family)
MSEPVRASGGARIPVKLHRHVSLIQTEDGLLAEELLARKKLAREFVGRLAENVLLVRPGRAEAVTAELKQMGHTPQIKSRDENSR